MKDKVTEKRRGDREKALCLVGSFQMGCNSQDWFSLKSGTLGLQHGYRGTSTWAVMHCFPWYISSQVMEQSWSEPVPLSDTGTTLVPAPQFSSLTLPVCVVCMFSASLNEFQVKVSLYKANSPCGIQVSIASRPGEQHSLLHEPTEILSQYHFECINSGSEKGAASSCISLML